jgi:shikimate kinase / 3-dehydroquinate synthase
LTPRAIVFIGFMGAGKTTAARGAAGALRRRVVDSDAAVTQRIGMPIEEFFEREGEAAFREHEEAVVSELLNTVAGDEVVFSLGGGAIESERVRAALARHTVCLVEIDGETAWERASRSSRPLARDRDQFLARLAARTPVYESLADAVLPAADAGVGARAATVLAELDPRLTLVWATAASGDYPVYFGEEAWPREGAFLVSDEHVAPLYGDRIESRASLEIAPGEQHKTLASAEQVWSAMAAAGVTRADTLVALGGGVVGDLGGFCAATYQRGIAVVQVPTTVVAQVDSAYGGKTGVDLPSAKNYVGAYHQPAAVHVVPSTLDTLPAAERAAGYVEVVKTALIAGGALWERVAGGVGVEPDVVRACARVKLDVVAADERDGGRRQVLNLGHTIGHAIETVTGYARYRHGEAVGLGLLAALSLSGQPQLREQVRELLVTAGVPVALNGVAPSAVAAATRADKKRLSTDVPFVLVAGPGDVTPGHVIAEHDILLAVEELAGQA